MSKITVNITKDKSITGSPVVSCATCERETNHLILASIEKDGSETDGDFTFAWQDIFQIIQCKGCDTISFRKIHTNSEDYDNYYDENNETDTVYHEIEELFPKRSLERVSISDEHLLPLKLQQIYKETLMAINASQPILTGIGIRAIIETICNDKGVVGDLHTRINRLSELSVLTKDGAAILHKLRVLGNRAAHEVTPHSHAQLDLALDVIDHLLTGVYVLPRHAQSTFDE